MCACQAQLGLLWPRQSRMTGVRWGTYRVRFPGGVGPAKQFPNGAGMVRCLAPSWQDEGCWVSTQCGLIIKVYSISTYVFQQKMYSWHMVAFTTDSFQLTCLQCQCTVHVSENRKWLMASYKQFANFWCDTLFYNHSGRTCLGEMSLEKCPWRNVLGEMSYNDGTVML